MNAVVAPISAGSPETAAGKRSHIVAILPRGEAIRNFVYSGALDDVQRQAALTVISVVPSPEILDMLYDRYDGVRALQMQRERWIVRFAREVLDMAHGRYLWSQAAQDRWRFRDIEAATMLQRVKRWGKKALCYPFANREGIELLSQMERAASRWFRTTEEYVDLYRELQPTLVFNSSHVHSHIAIPAIQAAQWLKIPTAAFLFSWDNLTSQGRLIPPYDYYLVWNEAVKQDLLRIYPRVRAEQIFVVGTPQFDFHAREEFTWSREEFCRRVDADPSRPIVLYSTGMPNHMPGEARIVEGIADVLDGFHELDRPQLLVRVYPKDRTGRFRELKQKRPDILFPEIPWEPAWLTPKIADLYLLTNMLRHCAAGINIASTVSLELCMFDKPVFNIAYNPPGIDISPVDFARYYEFDHYAPVVNSGAVELAHSESELAGMLREALRAPERRTAQRNALIQRMFGDTLDGQSARRVAETLLSVAS